MGGHLSEEGGNSPGYHRQMPIITMKKGFNLKTYKLFAYQGI